MARVDGQRRHALLRLLLDAEMAFAVGDRLSPTVDLEITVARRLIDDGLALFSCPQVARHPQFGPVVSPGYILSSHGRDLCLLIC